MSSLESDHCTETYFNLRLADGKKHLGIRMDPNPRDLVPTEAGTRFAEWSEQSAFGEAQKTGSRDDQMID